MNLTTFDADICLKGEPVTQLELLKNLKNLPIIKSNKKIEYYNVPAAFDIETTSFYEKGEKRACMYLWTFGVLNWVTYGRTWEELTKFVSALEYVLELTPKRRLVVYVHNLAYEFQFMRKLFDWNKVFMLDERKPVYAVAGGIEFKCSLKLSSKSLAKVAEDLQKYKTNKRVGDLDYSLARHRLTPITEKELGYAIFDVVVVLCYIQEKIETDGNITLIPLTNTGYVRNYCRKACYKRWRKYRSLMNTLTLTPDEYMQLKRAFQGGFTHANHNYVMKLLSNIGSYDFTSSYPAVMVLEKFPMSKAVLIGDATEEQLSQLIQEYCVMFDVEFWTLVPKIDCDHPISESRCWKKEGVLSDNGRVRVADYIKTTCTDVDYKIYKEFYNWDDIRITNVRIYERGYLPHNLVKAILDLYQKKTVLKDVEGEEINYMISKNMLNACYGMMVTDIVREVIEYLDDDTYQSTQPDMDEAIDTYNRSLKRFLFYPWGVWVTAYARANLFSGIIECKNDYIYSDTDSVKIKNLDKHQEYFDRYNLEIERLIYRASEFHKIDIEYFMPKTKNGKKKIIGQWDFEGTYDKFKTLGAKRYLTLKNGKYVMTVAGCNKKKAIQQLIRDGDPFEQFTNEMLIEKEYSGRITSTYKDEEFTTVLVDYTGIAAQVHEESYIHMEPSEYQLSMTEHFIKYIMGYKEDSW